MYTLGYYLLRFLNFVISETAYFASVLILRFFKDFAWEKIIPKMKKSEEQGKNLNLFMLRKDKVSYSW